MKMGQFRLKPSEYANVKELAETGWFFNRIPSILWNPMKTDIDAKYFALLCNL